LIYTDRPGKTAPPCTDHSHSTVLGCLLGPWTQQLSNSCACCSLHLAMSSLLYCSLQSVPFQAFPSLSANMQVCGTHPCSTGSQPSSLSLLQICLAWQLCNKTYHSKAHLRSNPILTWIWTWIGKGVCVPCLSNKRSRAH
jgi:hypothetical protein